MEYIVHHSDSYAATLVPSMIEMGVDVFQGCMETNRVDELIKKYGDKISFMGCIENADVDEKTGRTKHARKRFAECARPTA